MKLKSLVSLLTSLIFLTSFDAFSQEWRDKMKELIYTPYYFGPNALPLPEVRSGKIEQHYQIEFRLDNSLAKGDHTQDIYGRLYLPFGKKAAIEFSGVFVENYNMSDSLIKERHAINRQPVKRACVGDVVVTAMYELLNSEQWFDALFTVGLKTASGNMLCDARYTDAAAYWLDVHLGRNLIANKEETKYLRLVGLIGFYCYMTANDIHRQNDAWMAGIGIQSRFSAVSLDAGIRGFEGYWGNGDQPLLAQAKLKYEYKKHAVYFRYQGGLHDYIYQTCSGGYIFSF